MEPLLELEDVEAGYGGVPVLKQLSLALDHESVVGLIGRNGVGKTTTLRTIVGLLETNHGSIRYNGTDITNAATHDIYSQGIGLVPEDRGIFPKLTVRQNLQVPIVDKKESYTIEELFDKFPRLRERQDVAGDNLSGGEQQMLSFARALKTKPELLLLDEPSEGLAPQIVEDVVDIINEIAADGTSILLVEQNVHLILEQTSYAYVMDDGEIVQEGPSDSLKDELESLKQHLGVHRSTVK